MIRSDQIPPEVVEAAAKELAYTNGWRNQQGIDVCKPVARDILYALLSAWPGVTTTSWFENGTRKAVLNIPLPQEEPRDDA